MSDNISTTRMADDIKFKKTKIRIENIWLYLGLIKICHIDSA